MPVVHVESLSRDTLSISIDTVAVGREMSGENCESSEEERKERESSDFLSYKNAKGEFADFHANRHTFITRLNRSGISLGMAQKLARHGDPRLTANRYTPLEIEETAAAISNIPHPTKSATGMTEGDRREVARSGG